MIGERILPPGADLATVVTGLDFTSELAARRNWCKGGRQRYPAAMDGGVLRWLGVAAGVICRRAVIGGQFLWPYGVINPPLLALIGDAASCKWLPYLMAGCHCEGGGKGFLFFLFWVNLHLVLHDLCISSSVEK